MKDNRKEFVFVIGKSEGMDQEAMINGINSIIDAQKSVHDESTYSLVMFNEEYKLSALGKRFKEIRKYNTKTYNPKGKSALYDAMGFAITAVGDMLADTKEEDRPCQVCVIVIGEGDNASTECEYCVLDEMIKTQKYIYKWDFVFYGDGTTQFDIQKGGNMKNAEKMFNDINAYITALR